MTILAAFPGSEGRSTIETRASWAVCLTALAIAAVSFAAAAITVVGLKLIAADLGGERSMPALAYSLAWLGASVGGIAMGQAAERFGVRTTVIFGSLMIAAGLLLAQSGDTLSLLIGYGVFIGLLGNAGMNAPLYIYVSRWFDRRRGTALALLGSGSSVSAAIWAPIFAAAEAQIGWRNTMLGFATIEVALILPAAALMLGPAPEARDLDSHAAGPRLAAPVLGLRSATALSKTSPSQDVRSHWRDRIPPLVRRLGSKDPERRSRDEMALKVEGVVYGGVHAGETLSGSSRFEALKLALSSLQHPASDGFVGDVEPTLGEQILHVSVAQRKGQVEPYSVLDDNRRKTVAAIRIPAIEPVYR